MTDLRTPSAARRPAVSARAEGIPDTGRMRKGILPAVFVGGIALAILLSAVHLTQGTSGVGLSELWRLATGGGEVDDSLAVLVASRIPRLLAGITVGLALGAAGAVLQTVARNMLASPDTLAVNAGAYLAVVVVAAFGISLPAASGSIVAIVGGLLAAGLVLALSAGGGGGSARLVLAGTAIALALTALTTVLIILFAEETTGLFAWGSGSLGQTGLDSVATLGPVIAAVLLLLVLLAHRFDILALGEDAAASLGLPVQRTKVTGVVLAVVLSACAVTIAGPIGFVGLAAPAIVRLAAARIPGLQRHRALVPAAALMGVIVVIGADVLLRLVFGAQAGVEVPTGVVTTLFGALFLVLLARSLSDSTPAAAARTLARGFVQTLRGRTLVFVLCGVVLGALGVAGLLLGDSKLLGGDLLNWATGQSGPATTFILGIRAPRVIAALLAGAALAVAGAVVQAVSRNPLAEPAILGVSGGAGVGAVIVITIAPVTGYWAVTGGGLIGATIAALIVFGLAAKGGLNQNRLILIGIGVSAAAGALTSMLIVATDPYNGAKALTWLSGSTYGRTFEQLGPLLLVVLVSIPALLLMRGELDVIAVDDDTPRILGIRLGRTRLILLVIAVALTATAVSAVGVIGFVGLVAPHAARSIVGGRHGLVIPLSALLGAILVSLADTLGRTVIAPGQLPAGLLTAVVGAPYFVWLLWHSRRNV